MKGAVMSEASTSVCLYIVGDVRLDAPFPFLSPDMAALRKAEARENFSAFLSRAAEGGATHIVFAGNLLSAEYTTDGTVRFLIEELSKYPELSFIVLPGDEDVHLTQSVYLSGRLPKNVHIFSSEKPDLIEDGTAIFYGAAYAPAEDGKIPASISSLADLRPKESEKPGILLLPFGNEHAAAAAAFGAHCAVLSSPHTTVMEVLGEMPLVLSLGSAEGRHTQGFGEGAAVTAVPVDGGFTFSVARVPFSRRRYSWDTLSVDGARTATEVRERIAAYIREKGYGEETFLSLTLTGSVSAELLMHLDGDRYGLYGIRIADDTLPTLGAEELFRDMSVRGELYRSLEGAFRMENATDRRVIAEAVRIGLAALDDRDRE